MNDKDKNNSYFGYLIELGVMIPIAAEQPLERKPIACPKPKNEIVVSLCNHPSMLSIDVATERSLQWIKDEARQFTSDSDGMFKFKFERNCKVPLEINLTVSPCFDRDEVAAYLGNPVFTDAK